MIKLLPEYPVEQIGKTQLESIKEHNRVLTGLKKLVAKLIEEGDDAEDIAQLAWNCGFAYAESRFYHRDDLEDVPISEETYEECKDILEKQGCYPNQPNL